MLQRRAPKSNGDLANDRFSAGHNRRSVNERAVPSRSQGPTTAFRDTARFPPGGRSMPDTAQPRLICADSHVTITMESFLAHFPKKYRADVEDIVARARAAQGR
jgi:hypothetical protein